MRDAEFFLILEKLCGRFFSSSKTSVLFRCVSTMKGFTQNAQQMCLEKTQLLRLPYCQHPHQQEM